MTDQIELEGGKYTVVGIEDGRLRALRYGEEWRSLTGDNLVLCMAQEIRRLTEERDDLQARIDRALAAHRPFEWSFGYGPVKSCSLCAEMGATESQSAWPCETVRILSTPTENGEGDGHDTR